MVAISSGVHYWNANVFAADQYSQIRLTGAVGSWSGVFVRGNLRPGPYYMLKVKPGATDLYASLDGTLFQLAHAVTDWATGDVVRLAVRTVSATTAHLTVYRNEAELFNYDDLEHFIADGQPGIGLNANSGGTSLDDWEGGEPAITPGPSPTATATDTPTPTPTPAPTPEPTCAPGTFTFEGNSALSGTAGNIQPFTVNGVTVNVSAFSRMDSNGTWSASWLSVSARGLGVTGPSEGTGSNNQYMVDNIGGARDYVLFEFSAPIIVDQTLLDASNADSDMSAWIGTQSDPIANHLTLSDALLSSLGAREDNDTNLTVTRWAVINATQKVGNVLVISASVSDTTPEDMFRIHKLLLCQPGTPGPTP